MRILMLAPTPYFADRGCHVRIYEEARSLRKLGHDVRIVTYHLGRDMPEIPVIRIAQIPWYRKLEAGPSIHKLYLDLLLLFKAISFARKFRPHLIHAHLHEGGFIGYFLKKLFKVPMILDYQGSLTGECIDHGFFTKASFMANIFRRIETLINNFADKIITSSSAGASDLEKNWGQAPKRITTVSDGVDTDIFHPFPKHEGRQRLGIPDDIPVVAYLGLLNRYQGTDLLLECIEILKTNKIRVLFLIMGFPCEQYRSKAEARGINDMVSFTGKVDYQIAPIFLSAADIAVTPKLSATEANGKLFNYMACALPVISFDTPVNREVLGPAGIYVCYGDAAALAAEITDLLAENEKRINIAQLVRERAVREHSWAARGKDLEQVYRSSIMLQ